MSLEENMQKRSRKNLKKLKRNEKKFSKINNSKMLGGENGNEV
jgi:hypothetical protein